jgi:hypothetical protein
MKHFLAFVKATLLGGVIVVFPAWLAVLLVLKALAHLEIFVKPISKHLPQAIGHPRVIAILVLVGLCFLVGLAIHTAIGRRIERAAERLVLDKIPGYATRRSPTMEVQCPPGSTVLGDALSALAPSLPIPPSWVRATSTLARAGFMTSTSANASKGTGLTSRQA